MPPADLAVAMRPREGDRPVSGASETVASGSAYRGVGNRFGWQLRVGPKVKASCRRHGVSGAAFGCGPTRTFARRGCLLDRRRCHREAVDFRDNLAGVVGFEPTVHGTKNRCLTTWLHPSRCGGCLTLPGGGRKSRKPDFCSFREGSLRAPVPARAGRRLRPGSGRPWPAGRSPSASPRASASGRAAPCSGRPRARCRGPRGSR